MKIYKKQILFFALFAGSFLSAQEIISSEDLVSANPRYGSSKESRLQSQTKQTPPPAPAPAPAPPAIEKKKPPQFLSSHLQFGGSYTYVRITPGGGNPSTHGNLYGAQASYEYRKPNQIYAGLGGHWRQGSTHGVSTGRWLLDIKTEERVGYSWGGSEGGRWLFSLFSGFGYRYLGQKLLANGNSLHLNYNEFYFPVGFLLYAKIADYASLGLIGEWMPQVYPSVTLVPLHGARWTIDSQLENFLIKLPLTVCVTRSRNLAIVIEPFLEYWRDGHTSAKTETGISLNVPGNRYLFVGGNLNLRYSF